MKIDLNCDLGEGEPLARTRSLMRCITSANVACGGHGGDLKTMQACVRLAKEFGVRLGAHPGPWSRKDLGRGKIEITPDELELLLLQQVGALERLARGDGIALHHVKLHGALYHATETDEALATCYARAIRKWWPDAKIYARAGGTVARIGRRWRVPVWEEVFADRGYAANGDLIARDQSGALLSKLPGVMERLRGILDRREIITVAGTRLRVRPQTLCIHSDTPGATRLARSIAKILHAIDPKAPRRDG